MQLLERGIRVTGTDGARWTENVSLRAGGTFRFKTTLVAPGAAPSVPQPAPYVDAPVTPAAPSGGAAGLESSCLEHDGASCYAVASMYSSGDGVGMDKERAAQFFQYACELEQWDACIDLGRMYEDGDGVDADSARAGVATPRASSMAACFNGAISASPFQRRRRRRSARSSGRRKKMGCPSAGKAGVRAGPCNRSTMACGARQNRSPGARRPIGR